MNTNRIIRGALAMAYAVWSDMFAIEVPHIDRQHRQLLDIMNDFHASVQTSQDPNRIFEALNSLIRYVEQHFSDEEALMELSTYPTEAMKKHKDRHEQLVSDIFQLHERLAQNDEAIANDLDVFLNQWIIQHILLEDKKLAPHCTSLRHFSGRSRAS